MFNNDEGVEHLGMDDCVCYNNNYNNYIDKALYINKLIINDKVRS